MILRLDPAEERISPPPLRFPRIRIPGSVKAWAIMIGLSLIAALGAIVYSGTRFGMFLALAAGVGPIALLCALRAPLLLPYGLFVLLVPFDNLLDFKSLGTLTKLLGLASDAACLLWFVRTRFYVVPARSLIAWLPFVLVAAASFTWAPDIQRSVVDAESLGSLLLLFAIVSFMPLTRTTLNRILALVVFGGTLAGIYGAYLFHRGVDVSQNDRLIIGAGSESGMIDPNHFAAAMLVPLVLSMVALVYAKRATTRLICAGCACFIMLGIIISQSRGGLVAAAAMFLYLLIRSRRRLVLSGIGVAMLALGTGLLGQIAQRFGQAEATGGAGRLGIWRVAFAAFKAHPIAGVGLGNFDVAYNDAFLTVPAFATMKIIEGARLNIAPHSNVVWVGVELGALGLAALLYAWWMQFRCLRVIPREHSLYPVRLAMEAGLIGMFVCGLFLGTLTYKYLWLAFMLAVLTRNAYRTEETYAP